jgi:hypothetical protein
MISEQFLLFTVTLLVALLFACGISSQKIGKPNNFKIKPKA